VSDKKSKKERRQFRRIPLFVMVRYAPRQFGSNVPPDLWEGETQNISRSGAALKLPHRLRRGGRIELTFINGDPPRSISVVGDIVHCRRIPGAEIKADDGTPLPLYLVGVKFSRTLDLEELAMLRGQDSLDATEVTPRVEEHRRPAAEL